MPSKKRKVSVKQASQKIVDGTKLREYQEPELFKRKFQRSALCHSFRHAWHIPIGGCTDSSAYITFHDRLKRKDRDYAKSENFIKHRAELIKIRTSWAKGKTTSGDLDRAERNFVRFIPSVKYDEDLNDVVLLSERPVYWKNFIEQCLLFREVEPTMITKPLPEPKISWNNTLQRNELIIENIFSDTTAKDFTDKRFTEKFKRFQEKLPGYGPRPRSKKSLGFGVEVLELEGSGLSDREKADKIAGVNTDDPEFLKSPQKDLRDKNRVKSARRRMKQRIGLT